ncbi:MULTISPECIES: hypothetical protein [Mycolicibacter]|uniref:hypothetical protein n=1 Tax=Mycolicibacter TaxID=1073531 RepID=UPI0010551810|nr:MULTISPECIES: hypothetical protein [Mycolicibacter]
MPVNEVVALADAILEYAPAPLPTKLRRTLAEAVYRCAGVPDAYENPDWLRLRDQILAPGVDPLLTVLGQVLPPVAAAARKSPNPVVDQALAELGELPETILALGRNGPIPPMMERELISTMKRILQRVQGQYPPAP